MWPISGKLFVCCSSAAEHTFNIISSGYFFHFMLSIQSREQPSQKELNRFSGGGGTRCSRLLLLLRMGISYHLKPAKYCVISTQKRIEEVATADGNRPEGAPTLIQRSSSKETQSPSFLLYFGDLIKYIEWSPLKQSVSHLSSSYTLQATVSIHSHCLFI